MLIEVDPARRLSPVQSRGNIGSDIRAMRRSRKWTLNDLAELLGRSIGWLSQVERDVTEPALEDIRKIATSFNLPVGFFFTTQANQNEQHYIVGARSSRVTNDTSKGLREVLLSPDLGGAFEIIHSIFAPGARCPTPLYGQLKRRGMLFPAIFLCSLTASGLIWTRVTVSDLLARPLAG